MPKLNRISSKALEAPSTLFISIQCPRSMMSIRVASSQKKSFPAMKKVVAVEKKNATDIAVPISVIIPGCFFFISLTVPLRKGKPP